MNGLDQLLNAASTINSANVNSDLKVFRVSNRDIVSNSSTSKGNQTKWFKYPFWVKADTHEYESVSEVIVSLLLKYTVNVDYVKYNFCLIEDLSNNKVYEGCYSASYLDESEQTISLNRYLNLYNVDITSIYGEDLYDIINKLNIKKFNECYSKNYLYRCYNIK